MHQNLNEIITDEIYVTKNEKNKDSKNVEGKNMLRHQNKEEGKIDDSNPWK